MMGWGGGPLHWAYEYYAFVVISALRCKSCWQHVARPYDGGWGGGVAPARPYPGLGGRGRGGWRLTIYIYVILLDACVCVCTSKSKTVDKLY